MERCLVEPRGIPERTVTMEPRTTISSSSSDSDSDRASTRASLMSARQVGEAAFTLLFIAQIEIAMQCDTLSLHVINIPRQKRAIYFGAEGRSKKRRRHFCRAVGTHSPTQGNRFKFPYCDSAPDCLRQTGPKLLLCNTYEQGSVEVTTT